MKLWKKILLGTVATGAVAGGVTYLMRLKRTGAELETIPSVKIHKFDLKGLILRIDVMLKNPTRSPLKMKFPFVKLLYKGTTVGSSQVIDKDITLPGFGEAQISKIMVSIPVTSLFSLAGGLISALQQKQGVNVEIKTMTTLDLGWKKLPFNKSETVTIGNAQPDKKQLKK